MISVACVALVGLPTELQCLSFLLSFLEDVCEGGGLGGEGGGVISLLRG